MSFYFFSLLATVIGFLKPVWGFAIFLLGFSGAVGFFEKMGILGSQLGPFRADNMAIIGAIAGLWLSKKDKANSIKGTNAIEILLWFFTIMIVISRSIEIGIEDTWHIIKLAFYCLLYAPLYMAFKRLTIKERNKLYKLIIMASSLTACLDVIMVATNSQYLYSILVRSSENYNLPSNFVTARITIPGLWYLVPLGFWLSIREVFLSNNFLRFKSLLNIFLSSIMVISFLLNMSRSIILSVITSLFISIFFNILLSLRKYIC